jgi:hypothetical protein
VGPGGSQQDAAFALRASVPAGTYHVICDAVITDAIDVSFALIWRRGATDTPLATWTKHFDNPGTFVAQPYEVDMAGPAIDFRSGDQLVFRYAGLGAPGVKPESFIPNGDGPSSGGRLPSIALPP